MRADVIPIALGGVNSYLVQAKGGFVLVDTGGWVFSNGPLARIRRTLEEGLAGAGCQPGRLKLIVLTHGHVDHTANAAYLRAKYQAPIALHPADVHMVAQGDVLTWNRKLRPGYFIVILWLARLLLVFREREWRAQFERFTPDLLVEDGFDLAPYGLAAKVVGLSGHSVGSIGVLTAAGTLFCGDALSAASRLAGDPPYWPQMADADLDAADASLVKLKKLPSDWVYPGHGRPFQMQSVLTAQR